MQNSFTARQRPHVPPVHPAAFSPWIPGNHHRVTVTTVLPFPECCLVGIIWHVAFRTDFLHLTICIQGSSMSFRGLTAHFFLSSALFEAQKK